MFPVPLKSDRTAAYMGRLNAMATIRIAADWLNCSGKIYSGWKEQIQSQGMLAGVHVRI